MIFVGIDWSEQHHDVEVLDSAGGALARVRIPEGLEGIGRLHGLLAEHAEDPAEVVIGIETDHGLLVGALVAAGYQVFAINPQSVDRYRDRHSLSGAQSDPGDAKVLADLVRTDRHNHRPVAGDSDLAEAIKVTARAHQSLIWTRQRQVNQARSALREYYPGALAAFGTDLASPDALPVLAKAPTPAQGRRCRPRRSPRRCAAPAAAATWTRGRRRSATRCAPRSWPPRRWSPTPTATPSRRWWRSSRRSPARSPSSRPPWPTVLSSTRTPVSPSACQDSVSSSAPGCSRSSGTTRTATPMLRPARTTPAAPPSPRPPASTASCSPATGATTGWPTRSPGGPSVPSPPPPARAFYDRHRAKGDTHHQALRALSNRWVGILHGCLRYGTAYQEATAWGHRDEKLAAAA